MFPETRLLPAFLSFSSSDRIKKRNEQLLQMLPKHHPWHLFSSNVAGEASQGVGGVGAGCSQEPGAQSRPGDRASALGNEAGSPQACPKDGGGY